MGLVAAGSGAAFSNAAFANSTTPNADLRVVVEESLNFRANPDVGVDPDDFDPDNDNILNVDDDDDFFDGEDIADGGGEVFEDIDTPLAATNGEANGDLEIFAAAGIGEPETTFEELFTLENDSTSEVAVGIAYDRNNDDFSTTSAETGQYGDDIEVRDNVGLSATIPREAYRFEVNQFRNGDSIADSDLLNESPNRRISPNENDGEADSVGGNEGIEEEHDRPADAIIVGSGKQVTVDLVVDIGFTDSVQQAIRDQTDIQFDGFGTNRATVDLLDGITVGTLTDEP